MRLFPVPRTGLHVELLLRDEHPPPHLHVEDEEVPWEARFGFSYVTDTVRIMDIDPVEAKPSRKVLDRIRAAITANLARCREEWWNRIGTCGLDNRWMLVTEGRVTLLAGAEEGAVQVRTVRYDPARQELTFVMPDGTTHVTGAGKGIER